MRTAVSRKTNFRGYIVPELNDALTSACIFSAALIVNPHVFNWSATLWLAVLSPVAFPAIFQFLIWGTESRPSIRRAHEKQMEEFIAYLHEMFEERPDSTQGEASEIVASSSPEGIPIYATGGREQVGEQIGNRRHLKVLGKAA